MQVDHPGQHDPRPQVDRSGEHLGRGSRGGSHGGEPAGLVDDQEAVGLMAGPAGRQRRQDAGADRERWTVGKVGASHDGEASTPPRTVEPGMRVARHNAAVPMLPPPGSVAT